jgi:uncharacterized protein
VIHVGALPGTPRGSESVAQLVKQAKEEARVYRECGVDGVIIENMHDVIEASAAKLLRYRKMIGAERVWTDVKKKHSAHAITADVSLGQTAETVEFMGADCVIVTGSVTGRQTP